MSILPRAPAAAPPKGFRPHTSLKTKLDAALRHTRCPDCGAPIGSTANGRLDHDPPIQLRVWDEEAQDTSPPANDTSCLIWRHIDCHAIKTSGRRTKAAAEGDQTEIAKTKQLAKKTEEFRRRVLAKGEEPAPAAAPKGKRKIRSRGFDKTKKKFPNRG
jgi:hypothetical protein